MPARIPVEAAPIARRTAPFRTPRRGQQARDWLASPGDDGTLLAALLDANAVVGWDASGPETALQALAGLRPMPQRVPDTDRRSPAD